MGLSHYLDKLEETGMNLLVFSGEEVVYSSDKKGITPLIEAIEVIGGEGLGDLITADRIVGKAAALLNIYLEAQEVHAMLISAGAKGLLLERSIPFEFREETDAIKMKDGVIFCPFERMVQDVSDPVEAYSLIKERLAEF
jgi:hypothetical protein